MPRARAAPMMCQLIAAESAWHRLVVHREQRGSPVEQLLGRDHHRVQPRRRPRDRART
jgi:hypothetical protein